MIQEDFSNTNNADTMKLVYEEVNRFILVLEDMIQIVLNGDDVNSISMRELKERTIDAKSHLHNIRDTIIRNEKAISTKYYDLWKKQLDIYNDTYMDDVVTDWILNGSRDIIMDKLYSVCYKMRELIRKNQ